MKLFRKKSKLTRSRSAKSQQMLDTHPRQRMMVEKKVGKPTAPINLASAPLKVGDNYYQFWATESNEKIGNDILGLGTLPTSGHYKIIRSGEELGIVQGTCYEGVPCEEDCYSNKLLWRHPHDERIAETTLLLRSGEHYDDYVKFVSDLCKTGRYKAVRFNTDGDFFDRDYLFATIEIANQFKNIYFLAFTKNYKLLADLEREYRQNGRSFVNEIPENYRILLSTWTDDVFKKGNKVIVPTKKMPTSLMKDYKVIKGLYSEARYLPSFTDRDGVDKKGKPRFKEWSDDDPRWNQICGGSCSECMYCFDLPQGDNGMPSGAVYLPDHTIKMSAERHYTDVLWARLHPEGIESTSKSTTYHDTNYKMKEGYRKPTGWGKDIAYSVWTHDYDIEEGVRRAKMLGSNSLIDSTGDTRVERIKQPRRPNVTLSMQKKRRR